ncbi:hypothetical protein PGB90_005455 [Kerria lacca]
MVFVNRCALTMCLTAQCLILIAAQGPGPGLKKRSVNSDLNFSSQMQSRAVDTKVQLEIFEGQPRGTVVGSIPVKPGFTYRFNESPKEFSLNGTTGEIRTTVILDRENLKNDRFDLVVLSSQPTYPIEVRVLVLDVNDNAPEFPESTISVSFSENAASGTKLLLDTATDRDIGVNEVTDDYRIVSGNTDDKFHLEVIRNPSGDTSYLYLCTTGKLDRETTAAYQLNISAKDGGIPTHYGYVQVNVTILDVNDNPPIFALSDYSVSLNESSPVGTKVLKVHATDDDDGDNARISYYLVETERRFSVDAKTGDIFIAEHLDCLQQNCPQIQQPKHGKNCPKSCVFTVYARDHGSPQQDGRAYVTVNLLDANDHDPIIKFSYFPSTAPFATVDENALNGSVVAAVSVVDPDDGLNGETTVAIKAGNELHHFRMESAQSFDLIRVNGILDREHISKYNLTVVAFDKGTPSRTVTAFLIIYVNDVNDHEPVFEKSEYSAVLNELTPVGTYVAGITATDEDTGVNALIYYNIVSGNDYRWFSIDSDTGLVITKAALDREKSGTVELKITARDGGPNPRWAYTQLKVTILDENDEAPQFAQDIMNVSFPEDMSENTLIATVTAFDHDQGTNGSVIYGLHPDTVVKYPSVFSVNSVTGQITTVRNVDRETIPFYQIKVIAKDQGLPPLSATTTVFLSLLDVNDNVPVFYPIWYFARINDQSAPGSTVLRVFASDADQNEKIVYNIEESEGLFYINESTGTIHLKSSVANHRESVFHLTVSATDRDGKKSVENAIIEITKNISEEDLIFEKDNYLFQTREDDGLQEEFEERELGKVEVRLQNNYGNIRYFIVSGDPKKLFDIGEHNGIFKTRGKIDREEQSAYSLTVIAKSRSSVAKTRVNVTIHDLNDNKPQFGNEKDEVTMLENTAVGQEIFLVRAKDKDSGSNSRITYSMASDSDQFRIGSDTGVIYLNKPLKVLPGIVLNAEIKATDSGSPALWSKHSVFITVLDVNDHTPVFEKTSYETSLLESITVNERFIPIVAMDEDIRENGALSYNIINGNNEGKFGIFPDGYVYVRKKLDRESEDYYCLTIEVKDNGNPQRSSSVPLVVHILDENDNKPEFANTSFNFQIAENEPIDTFVGKIIAIDKDVGRNAELTFSLFGKQNDFVIDSKNGFIRTARTFDREYLVQTTGQNFIVLEATVTDNGIPALQDKVKINIFISDVNDNAPQFLRLPYKISLSESSSLGTQVMRVFTSDADEGLNRDVFYFISAGNEEKRFAIDRATGLITLAKLLDREKTARYQLIVTAYDAGVVCLCTNASVIIEISDENDNAPTFVNADTRIVILENAVLNSKLYQFSAIDPDAGVNQEIFFSIGSGNRRESFQIDPLSGVLYLRKKLDYEDVSSYVLNITAYDGGNPRLSTTLLLTVAVEDYNDNPPAFPSTAIVRQIRENIPINTPIVTVSAEDPDSGLNGKIVYSIVKQEPITNSNRFHFQINSKTGVIHTQLPIDRESVDTFRLTVRATDQALLESDRLFAEKMVTVIVEDVNDNSPSFVSMNAAILKGTTVDFPVMSILAKDPDSGSNGIVTYDLIGGSTDLFYIHRSSGSLRLKLHISEMRNKYHLSVKATDEAVQSDRRSVDQFISIITPGKKNELIFNEEFGGNVYENEPIGTNILTVFAHHITNTQYEIEYYITNVTGLDDRAEYRIFDIDTKLGIISTAEILDREAGSEWYEVEVHAIVTNSLTPISGVTKVRILFLNFNN